MSRGRLLLIAIAWAINAVGLMLIALCVGSQLLGWRGMVVSTILGVVFWSGVGLGRKPWGITTAKRPARLFVVGKQSPNEEL